MKKRKKNTKKKQKKFDLKIVVYLLLLVIFSLMAFIIGILYTQKEYKKELQKKDNALKTLQQKIDSIEKTIKKPCKVEPKNNISNKHNPPKNVIASEILDYQKAHKNIKPKQKKETQIIKTASKSKKPKLVIIIDDMAFKYQVKLLKQIPYPVTPSFFPPTNRHPNTQKLAKNFDHYMVHLPLQAIHFNKPEPKTLNIDDSYNTILKRVTEIKKEFPKAKFINNHTGSTFTSNEHSMILLFKALKKEDLGFVDSKTTPHSKSKDALKEYKIPLYSRNIFLDNIETKEYIQNQLKKAVKIAKKRGYAIAIGHPHKITLTTLKESKNILKGVDVVYIDQLKNGR